MPTEPKLPAISSIKASHVTLTTATAEMLRDAIQQGSFPPGSQLPPELELINMLGVSRTTLREALRALEEQRLIVRRRGLGTFVSERSIRKDLSINFGITEMVRQAGMTPGSRDLNLRREKASPALSQVLRLERGADIVVLDRVRTANERPVVWSQDILPEEILGEHAIETLRLEYISLYQYLEERLNLQIFRGEAQLRPETAGPELAGRLNVRVGTPLLYVAQTDFNGEDRPVIHSIEYHVPDAFVFVVNRRGPHW